MIKIKYDGEIHETTFEEYLNRIIGNIFKLLPLKEKEQDWDKHLEGFLEDLAGCNEVFLSNPSFLSLICKLEGLKNEAVYSNRTLYRKTVLDSITLTKALFPRGGAK
jgi:hypothetical protein